MGNIKKESWSKVDNSQKEYVKAYFINQAEMILDNDDELLN